MDTSTSAILAEAANSNKLLQQFHLIAICCTSALPFQEFALYVTHSKRKLDRTDPLNLHGQRQCVHRTEQEARQQLSLSSHIDYTISKEAGQPRPEIALCKVPASTGNKLCCNAGGLAGFGHFRLPESYGAPSTLAEISLSPKLFSKTQNQTRSLACRWPRD